MSSQSPYFSVIIPLYNKERDIVKTLESLLQQEFQDFEVIVVDDGSSDNSAALVKGFSDKRIQLYQKENEGVSPTRNFGVAKANAPYIAFLDADDFWYPYHLLDLEALTQKFPEGKWYATAYEKKFNEKLTRRLQSPIMEQEALMVKIDDFFQQSFADCIAWTSAVAFRKDFFQSLGGFDTDITMGAGEDTDLWVRAALASPLYFHKRVSATHNLEGSNRITKSPTLRRRFWDMDQFETMASSMPSLKKFLDINRYSQAMQFKLAGDQETSNRLKASLSKEHLTFTQLQLLKLPAGSVRLLLRLKNILNKGGIDYTSFSAKNSE